MNFLIPIFKDRRVFCGKGLEKTITNGAGILEKKMHPDYADLR